MINVRRNKHLKVKQNYGLETVPIYFNKLLFGGGFASETAPTKRKRPRFYALMEQEIEHPILVWFNKGLGELEIFNGGLRVMVAVEKGFDSIDGIIRAASNAKPDDEDFILIKKLKRIQQQDAKNYFKWEDLETVEQ
tara:strand:+ start:834 stop:1244 length:411 start_codon:yes stop_codon:yes gene_type:complete